MDATAYRGTGSDIDFGSGLRSCIARGDFVEPGYRSAWWRYDGMAPRFLLAGHGCGAAIHAMPVDDWVECGATRDEPPECRVLCAQNVCPGELDWNTLTACDVASRCPAAYQQYDCGPVNPDLQCIHAALADRTPGRYDVGIAWPNDSWSSTFVVADDGSARVTLRDSNTNVCGSAFNGMWQPSQTCDLADAQFFAMCAMAETWCGGDLDQCQNPSLAGWFVGCTRAAATCD
jgi:hypothetical protein